MDVHCAHACLRNQVHTLGIHFDNLIQALHQKDDTAAYGNSAISKTGAAAAHCDGHHIFVAQLDDSGDFLGGTGTHHGLRHAETAWVVFLVSFVHIQLFRVGEDIFFANDGFYFTQKLWADRIIGSHYFSS